MQQAGAIRLEGFKKLERKLDRFKNPSVRRRIMSKAIKAGTKPVIKQARKGATKETGLLRKSIGFKAYKYLDRGILGVVIGVRKDFKQQVSVKGGYTMYRNPQKYHHLKELGFTHFSGKKIKGLHYLERALKTKSNEALAAIKQKAAIEIEKEAAKK